MPSIIAPPFTDPELAARKVQLAEDLWNTRDPERVASAYTEDSLWRNRTEFLQGRDQIVAFLTRKWNRELGYRLKKELWVSAITAWPCASNTSGMTKAVNGSAAMAANSGSSPLPASCSAAKPASTTTPSTKASAGWKASAERLHNPVSTRTS